MEEISHFSSLIAPGFFNELYNSESIHTTASHLIVQQAGGWNDGSKEADAGGNTPTRDTQTDAGDTEYSQATDGPIYEVLKNPAWIIGVSAVGGLISLVIACFMWLGWEEFKALIIATSL